MTPMKKDITKIFGGKTHQETLMVQFEKLRKQAKDDKAKIRRLEMKLLRPKPIEKYSGPRASLTDFKKRCLTLTFNNPSFIKLWSKYFKVNFYLENNTYDLDFILELFNLMENDRVKWNSKEKKFHVKLKNEKTITL
jgi:hypothetical protein